ncbi:hypothetical protein JTE90_022102 [Oedothorax gibbosus]|uniref:Uncharacterized protein n=1 Tax=Oedothorax gibbosus TaxID=931172 RepID=A0AAV6U1I3_9ARAC|nr:hypothetical protein JTE90_022102 [Oedothorax gibbosus]
MRCTVRKKFEFSLHRNNTFASNLSSIKLLVIKSSGHWVQGTVIAKPNHPPSYTTIMAKGLSVRAIVPGSQAKGKPLIFLLSDAVTAACVCRSRRPTPKFGDQRRC